MTKKLVVDINGRDEYRSVLDKRPDVPLWQQPWWLDATAGDEWDALCLHDRGQLVAALPYLPKTRGRLTAWSQPPLTQSQGPWLYETVGPYERRLAKEHMLLTELARAIPRDVLYTQNWHPSRANWLPFYWAGFHQETRYTYQLDLTQGEAALWSNLSPTTRTQVSKCKNRLGATAEVDSDVADLLHLIAETFERQNKTPPFPDSLIHRVFAAASVRGAVEVWVAKDAEKVPAAGALIVRDASTAYYLIGGAHPQLRATGAQKLVLWEAIRAQVGHVATFDFEGSMIKSIERAFRSYGASQTPYFTIYGSKRRAMSLAAHGRVWVTRQGSQEPPRLTTGVPSA